MEEWQKWLGLLAVILAVVTPLAGFVNITLDWAVWVIAVIGLALGLTMKSFDEKLLLSALILLTVSTLFAIVPVFGSVINEIFKNFGVFAGAIVAIPAVRIVAQKFKVKF